jgi:hypothetical protein
VSDGPIAAAPLKVRLEFVYTFDEYKEALAANRMRSKLGSKSFLLPSAVGPSATHQLPPLTVSVTKGLIGWIIWLGLAVLIFARLQGYHFAAVQLLWFTLPLTVILVVAFLGYWFPRRNWKAQPGLQNPRVVEVDSTGVFLSDATFNAHFKWLAFTQVVETNHLFVLYTSKVNFLIIPKRAGDNQSIPDLREMLRLNIADRPTPAFSVVSEPDVAGQTQA